MPIKENVIQVMTAERREYSRPKGKFDVTMSMPPPQFPVLNEPFYPDESYSYGYEPTQEQQWNQDNAGWVPSGIKELTPGPQMVPPPHMNMNMPPPGNTFRLFFYFILFNVITFLGGMMPPQMMNVPPQMVPPPHMGMGPPPQIQLMAPPPAHIQRERNDREREERGPGNEYRAEHDDKRNSAWRSREPREKERDYRERSRERERSERERDHVKPEVCLVNLAKVPLNSNMSILKELDRASRSRDEESPSRDRERRRDRERYRDRERVDRNPRRERSRSRERRRRSKSRELVRDKDRKSRDKKKSHKKDKDDSD